MLIANSAEIMMIIGMLMGIWISGSDLPRLNDFAFRAIRKISIPVIPPDMTPPIPRMNVNPSILKYSAEMYSASGTRDVRMKFFVFDVLMSRRNMDLSENERTKYEVNIVKIPRIVIRGPKERVATSEIEFPRIPMNTAENNM